MEPVENPEAVTRLLLDWKQGSSEALNELTPIVYRELRRIANSSMRRERSGHTLQPTALIHEAYLRLVSQNLPDFQERSHFFALSARIMRQVLVDSARSYRASKRGSGLKAEFEESLAVATGNGGYEDILSLHEAMDRLAAFDERRAKVIELRYFGGLERAEIADLLGTSLATVKRDIALGEGWLRREMGVGPGANPGPGARAQNA
jgi:RNA polymerase sigma factor (TIGR02999 family)